MKDLVGDATLMIKEEVFDIEIFSSSTATINQCKFINEKFQYHYSYGNGIDVVLTTTRRLPVEVGHKFLILDIVVKE